MSGQTSVEILFSSPPISETTFEENSQHVDISSQAGRPISEIKYGGMKGDKGDPGPPGPEVEEQIQEHIDSPTPHPIYDDGPSLELLYENAKV